MAINYSLSQRYAHPLVVNPLLAKIKAGTATSSEQATVAAAPKLWYANAQASGQMTLEQFATHIAQHGGKYGKADVYAVLINAVECLREQLLEGRSVSLGDLGSFSLSIQSEGTANAGDFTRANIKSVNTNWTPGSTFQNMLADATFTQVLTAAATYALLKLQNGLTLTTDDTTRLTAIQARITAANASNSSSGSTDNSGSGSGNGDNGDEA